MIALQETAFMSLALSPGLAGVSFVHDHGITPSCDLLMPLICFGLLVLGGVIGG